MKTWLLSKLKISRKYAPAEEGLTIYAIGDIHGRVDCLRRAQEAIDRDASSRPSSRAVEIYVGDYIDRGPESSAVLENLIARGRTTEVVPLLGNHETLLTSFLEGRLTFAEWRELGGAETVMSYGVNASRLGRNAEFTPDELAPHMPKAHLDFLGQLRPYFETGAYCFVHAGLRAGRSLAQQSVHDLTWIREDFLEYPGPFGYIVVHGHTPVRDIEFRRHRINIDTGAYLTNKLSVLCIDDRGPKALEIGAI